MQIVIAVIITGMGESFANCPTKEKNTFTKLQIRKINRSHSNRRIDKLRKNNQETFGNIKHIFAKISFIYTGKIKIVHFLSHEA